MQHITDEEKTKIKALPLIDLDENDSASRDIILQGIKDVFTMMKLTLMDELDEDSCYHLAYSRQDESLTYPVEATYDSDRHIIMLSIEYSEVSKGKRKKIKELINLLNIGFPQSSITSMPDGAVVLKSCMFLSSWFNTQELYWNLKSLLFNAKCYLTTAAVVMTSNMTPEAIVERFNNYLQKLMAAESNPIE